MKVKEIGSVVELLRNASRGDLVIISLFLVPILLGGWCILLDGVLLEGGGWEITKLVVVGAVFLVYLVAVVWTGGLDSKKKRLTRARRYIENWLRERPKPWASFDAIRSYFGLPYDDAFLEELIKKHEDVFHGCTIKKGNKPGIALEKDDEALKEPDAGSV